MLILTLRTDKPQAEIGLFDDTAQILYETWEAHRQLAETIHLKLQALLSKSERNLSDIQAIACYKGPGSFTGLRIGLSVANALAYSLQVPISGAEGEDWLKTSLQNLLEGKSEKAVMPEYGAPVHITTHKD